ncbi:MAG TPA: DEAD/DEAH box helicase family protein, partial [Candidatus Limnocylindria bacterium]|nr:DEAD/DEAH box helicase family protein [Candidatus Limnocylindria bacterium]
LRPAGLPRAVCRLLARVRLVFDRGTILVRDPPPGFDPEGLPGLRWDSRVGAHRAPAHRYEALRTDLERRRLPVLDQVLAHDTPPDAWRPVELRPYQEAAVWAWELASRRALLVLPTGSGKTRTAIAAMARARCRTLCLVPTRVLLEQWIVELGRVYTGRLGCLGDGTYEVAAVTVATFESAYRRMERLGNRFDLLVVDEVHHFGSGVRDEALEMSTAAARLGLTATPPRAEPAAGRLLDLVGSTAYELTIGDLTGRFLAAFDAVTLHLDLTDTERATYEGCMAEFRDVHARFRGLAPRSRWEDFVRTAARTAEGRRALAAFHRARRLLAFTAAKREALDVLLARHRDARVLVFTADNESAYAVSLEHLIMPITCDIGRTERHEALARFRDGALRALVSARVLNEGIDVPDADVAIVVGGTLGEREHAQRVGRLLRPREGKRALVYELVLRRTMEAGVARRRRSGLAPRGLAAVQPAR